MKLDLSDQYDHKALVKYGLTIVVLAALLKATGGMMAFAFSLFAFAALMTRKSIWLLWWVLFFTFVSMSNPVLFGSRTIAMLNARLVLVAMTGLVAFKVFNSRNSRPMMPIWGIMVYILWEFVVSLQGYAPMVSYLKLILFCCIFLAMFGVANEVNASSRVNARILRSAILSIVAFITIGCVLLMPFPGLSTMTGTEAAEAVKAGEAVSLFCGVCSHSQAMGPLAAILATFLLADLVFSIKRWDKFYLLMLLCCPLICWRTSSRTGMATMVAGWGMVLFFFVQSRGVGTRWKQRVMSVATMLMVVGGVAVMAVPKVRERATSFILKTAATKSSGKIDFDRVVSSRQKLIDEAKRNFKKKPLLGNGFQVAEEMAHQRRVGWKSYLAAPIEKGVWIFALPEEGGVIGMVLFCGWLLILFPTLYKRHAYVMASTFFAFLMANMGEFCIFAMSYVGGFYWTLVFAAGTLDVQRMKGQNIPVFFVPIEQVQAEVGMDEWVRKRG